MCLANKFGSIFLKHNLSRAIFYFHLNIPRAKRHRAKDSTYPFKGGCFDLNPSVS